MQIEEVVLLRLTPLLGCSSSAAGSPHNDSSKVVGVFSSRGPHFNLITASLNSCLTVHTENLLLPPCLRFYIHFELWRFVVRAVQR